MEEYVVKHGTSGQDPILIICHYNPHFSPVPPCPSSPASLTTCPSPPSVRSRRMSLAKPTLGILVCLDSYPPLPAVHLPRRCSYGNGSRGPCLVLSVRRVHAIDPHLSNFNPVSSMRTPRTPSGSIAIDSCCQMG